MESPPRFPPSVWLHSRACEPDRRSCAPLLGHEGGSVVHEGPFSVMNAGWDGARLETGRLAA